MDHSRKSTYLFSIDALRVVAIAAVILVHVSTKAMDVAHFDIIKDPFSLFLNQASRFAVPLFFLISGFVLELNNRNGLSYLNFFKKRASRIVIPFIFWSAFYFYIGWGYNISKLFSQRFLMDLLTGNASYHLYFIPTLILFYLVFPFLHSKIKFLKYPLILVSIFLIQFVLLYYDYYIKQLSIHYDLRVALLSTAMFIAGMIASHYKEEIYLFTKKYSKIFLLLIIILPLLIFIHVRGLTLEKHSSGYIYNQYSPLNYVYTLVLASLFYFVMEKTQFMRHQFMGLSKLSFFVFFIHVLILDIIWNNVVSGMIKVQGVSLIRNIWFTPLLFVIVGGISFGIAYVVHKISWAPKITG